MDCLQGCAIQSSCFTIAALNALDRSLRLVWQCLIDSGKCTLANKVRALKMVSSIETSNRLSLLTAVIQS